MGRLLRLLKSDFTSGEVDPLLKARTDIKHYFSGAETLRNVIVMPQGGIKDRPGLKFVNDVSTLNSGNDPDDGARFVSFEFDSETTFLLLFLDQEIRFYKNGAQVHSVTGLTQWTGAILSQLNFTQSNDTLIIFHPSVQPYSIVRVSDTNWTISAITFDYIPKYDYSPSTSTPAWTITPAAVDGQTKITGGAGSNFTSGAYVGQKISGNGGLARVVQVNSTTELVAVVEIPFYNTDAITTTNWTLHSGFEDAWSGSRGWPACGTFHDGRLWMGGGPRPSTLWGSRIGEYFDFEPGSGLDDEPIEYTLDTDQLNAIVNLFSLIDLVIFTIGGEFFIADKPITPNQGSIINATRRGSKVGLRVVELDGAALYIQRGGKAVREFVKVEDGSNNYTSDNLSLLSSHMINDPIDFVKRRSTSTEESDLLILVNPDGTAAICSTIRSQQVVAWSTMDTPNGEIMRVGVDDTDIYFLIKRTIDGASAWFVEKFDDTLRLDCAVYVDTSAANTSTITAAHLLNEDDIHCYADDNYQGSFTLDGSGQATIPNESDQYYEVGYFFQPDPIGVTLPIEPALPEGTAVGKKKRIVEIVAELYQTEHLVLNGREPSFKQFGVAGSGSPLDVDGVNFTGRITLEGFLGYSEKAQVTISKNRPGRMTLLGVGIQLSV